MNIADRISVDKKFLVTIGVILICLFLYAVFPTSNTFQDIVSSLTFLFAIPALYTKIILKGSLKNLGLQLGDKKKGAVWGGLALLFSVLIFYALFNYTSLSQNYRPPQFITERFAFFVAYELFLVGFFVFLYEFFFRGFFMLGALKRPGWRAIAAQFILFSVFLLATGNFNWSFSLYLIAAPFAGIVAFQSRSILYSFAASLFFIIIADALAIGLTKT